MTSVTTRRLLPGLLAAGLLLAGCGAGDDEPTSGTPTEDAAEDMSDEDMSDDEMSDDEMADDMADDEMEEGDHEGDMSDDMDEDAAPAVAGAIAGVDATTPDGGTLTLADFAGQQVFVETFATWCSNCRRQLETTQQAAAEAGDDAVFLALSVETDLDPAALTDYAAENGFDDLTFAVLSPEAVATLVAELGNSVANPPAVPKFTIASDGTVSDLATGPESLEEILAQLEA